MKAFVRRASLCAAIAGSLAAHTASAVHADPATLAPITLTVEPHRGGEAIDVSGSGPARRELIVTLVSTFSLDLPDAIVSRTVLRTSDAGAYRAVLSIASGSTRGSVLTVYVTADGDSATMARYRPDAPNRGIVVPLDQIPSQDQ